VGTTANAANDPAPERELAELRAEVSGLRRALESRGLIERAKGILMYRHGWTADEAFQYLVRLSQHTNIRLAELAERITAEAASARGAATDDAWAYRLLDLFTQPAMMLRPLPGRHEPVADFRVEYANPATLHTAGRSSGDIVGRRLSRLYPPPMATDMLATCVRALQPAAAARPASAARSSRLRLRAMPLQNKVLLTWQ
jgi:hypothetical protein